MRTLLVIHGLGGGGAERVMCWLANELNRHGHEVTMLVRSAASSSEYPLDDAVVVLRQIPPKLRVPGRDASRIRRAPRSGMNRLRILAGHAAFSRLLRRTVRERRIDVVLSFIDVMNLVVAASLRNSDTPFIVSERVDPDFDQLGRLVALRPVMYRASRCVVVQSAEIANRVRKDWHLKQVAVIGNPAPHVGGPLPHVLERPKRVITAGRLHEQKNHAALIEAWSSLGAVRDGWELHIFGEGPLRDALQRQISRLKLSDVVFLRGAVSDMSAEYRQAQVFALPSLYEGFPNALVEAMAFGCACIATDAPGSAAEMLSSSAGVVIKAGDTRALTVALARLISNESARSSFSQQATRRASAYSAPRIYDLWERVLFDGRVE